VDGLCSLALTEAQGRPGVGFGDAMPDDDAPPYWVLISVLFSSQPLTPPLAMALHHAAFELYRSGGSGSPLAGDLLSGRITNLQKDVLLGDIAGPAFEAEIETERGSGVVRFLLTRQGLELMNAREVKPSTPRYLN
jgi:hypothetical protein